MLIYDIQQPCWQLVTKQKQLPANNKLKPAALDTGETLEGSKTLKEQQNSPNSLSFLNKAKTIQHNKHYIFTLINFWPTSVQHQSSCTRSVLHNCQNCNENDSKWTIMNFNNNSLKLIYFNYTTDILGQWKSKIL